jgi:hypothetical protein
LKNLRKEDRRKCTGLLVSFGFPYRSAVPTGRGGKYMLVFIPGLPQRMTVIPDPDNQSAQTYWAMIDIGEWYLVDSKMLCLILQPFHREYPQQELFPSNLRLTVNQLMPIGWILVGWKGKPVYPIMYSGY